MVQQQKDLGKETLPSLDEDGLAERQRAQGTAGARGAPSCSCYGSARVRGREKKGGRGGRRGICSKAEEDHAASFYQVEVYGSSRHPSVAS